MVCVRFVGFSVLFAASVLGPLTVLLCHCLNYTTKVDIWSLGCCLAEMALRRVFFKGKNMRDQVGCIVRVLGKPEAAQLVGIQNVRARAFIMQVEAAQDLALSRRLSRKRLATHIAELSRTMSAGQKVAAVDLGGDGISLLESMLRWEAAARKNATECLEHDFLCELHDPDDEPIRTPILPENFRFERHEVGLPYLVNEIYRELIQSSPHLQEQSFCEPPREYDLDDFPDLERMEEGVWDDAQLGPNEIHNEWLDDEPAGGGPTVLRSPEFSRSNAASLERRLLLDELPPSN